MKGIVLSLTLTIVIAAAAMGIARAVGDRTEVRILAQRLDDGRTEFGLQYREADDTWSDTVLPHRRYFPADPEVGNWLVSSGVMVQQRPPSPLPVDGLYGTEAWQPYRDDTYFVRCPSTIEDEHIHVAIVAVGPAYYDHPCLKPDGAVQLYYNNDFDKLIFHSTGLRITSLYRDAWVRLLHQWRAVVRYSGRRWPTVHTPYGVWG